MMFPVYAKMALAAIRTAKWRSFLTMLGIIVGVASVVIIVSLGEGVKREVVGQIDHLGSDLITVRPGKSITRDKNGNVASVNVLQALAGGATFNDADFRAVQKAPGVGVVVPMDLVSGTASVEDHEFAEGFTLGTTEGMPQILNQKVEFGVFFDTADANRNVAVIGQKVALNLFGENAPIGRAFTLQGQSFQVRGVFRQFSESPLTPNADYNSAIFIPYETAKRLNKGQTQIQQILAKPQEGSDINSVTESIDAALSAERSGQHDYAILRQQDNLAVANKVLNLFTGLISAIAAISLIVGGIGVMNIMLVSVSERTHEIGVRKAIGATNNQILGQFLVESAAISAVGGLLGVIVSIVADYLIRVFTPLSPIITWQVVVIAGVVALAVGVFFGVAPAMKAARKDPIDALRQYQ